MTVSFLLSFFFDFDKMQNPTVEISVESDPDTEFGKPASGNGTQFRLLHIAERIPFRIVPPVARDRIDRIGIKPLHTQIRKLFRKLFRA